MNSIRSVVLSFLAFLYVASACPEGYGATFPYVNVLGSTDQVVAIDLDARVTASVYPIGEPPARAIDGSVAAGNKYVNFGAAGSGFIVTPGYATPTVASSFRITTANDSTARDPAAYELWGTTDSVTSPDNSIGRNEDWVLISAGYLNLPLARNQAGPVTSFSNSELFDSYKLLFPRTRSASNAVQIAEIELVGDIPGLGISNTELLNSGDAIRAVADRRDSLYADSEGPENSIDGDIGSTYVNAGGANSGLIITPSMGPTTIAGFEIVTASYNESGDPVSYAIYGTNDAVTSTPNSVGDGEMWTLLQLGTLGLPSDRSTNGGLVEVNTVDEYLSYRVVFPTLKGGAGSEMNIGEIRLYSIPEPDTLAMQLIGLLCSGWFARNVKRGDRSRSLTCS
jgi:hypothetical protein